MKKKNNMEHSRIYHGDNMYYMPDMPDQCIDLIYIDPPFGTQSLLKSKAFKERVQELKFYDMCGGGKEGYINFMRERLRHMHRLLKPTGSLFVHLDWRMAHYIKIELDKIFGVKNPAGSNTNFINEIVWCYRSGGASKKHWSRKHDTILFYAKDKNKYKEKFEIKRDQKSYLQPTSGKDPKQNYYKDEKGEYTLVYPKDWWDDVFIISPTPNSKERTGWPTQKPLSLLNKIIKATTKPGDLVADFFCGCGTSIVSAQRLNRKWIGFDASMTACKVMLKRIKEDQPLFNQGISRKPMTIKDFEKLKPFDFEKHAVRHVGGVTNDVQVGDGGVDGRLAFDGTPIQVKKFNKPLGDDNTFRGFYEPIREHGRGIFITLNGYTNKAKERANKWRSEGLEVHLLTIKVFWPKTLTLSKARHKGKPLNPLSIYEGNNFIILFFCLDRLWLY